VYCVLCDVMVNEWNVFLVSVCSGQSPAEADFNLLDTARKVDVYGLHLFAAHVRHSQPCFKLNYLILILQFRNETCSSGGGVVVQSSAVIKVRQSAPERRSATSDFSRVVLHHLYFSRG